MKFTDYVESGEGIFVDRDKRIYINQCYSYTQVQFNFKEALRRRTSLMLMVCGVIVSYLELFQCCFCGASTVEFRYL